MIKHSRQQRTIARTTRLKGHGYWAGRDVMVEFRPAAPDTGYVFIRGDLTPNCSIKAQPANRVPTPRRTTLAENGAIVQMVEHGLAALAGMQIDNCEIVVFGSELPAGDGSSQAAVNSLLAAGVQVQDAQRESLRLEETIRVGADEAWIEARPTATFGFSIRYELDYGPGPIGQQTVEIELNPESFCSQLAAARTFLLDSEVAAMKSQGAGANTSYQNLLIFAEDGPIQNTLRFPDECARHKALDIVGDLAILGFDLHASIVAHRSGHRHNAELAQALYRQFHNSQSLSTPT